MGVALFSEYRDLIGRAALFTDCKLSEAEREDVFQGFCTCAVGRRSTIAGALTCVTKATITSWNWRWPAVQRPS